MLAAGLDVGTSGCKIVVYDLQGNIVAAESSSYKEEGTDGYRELVPLTVLTGVKDCIKGVIKKLDEPLLAMAIGTLGESIVCIDKAGDVLGKSTVTGDKRGISEVEELVQRFGKKKIMEITGIPASEMYSLPKLLLENKNTDNIKKAKYIFLYEDYIAYYLTGLRKVSYSSASRTMAFDIEKKAWSKELLGAAGILVKQMSEPVNAGTVVGEIRSEVAKELGLSEGLQIVTGGHDQECAALGAGVISTGMSEDGHGTCEVMNIMLEGPLKTEYMMEQELACIPGMIPNTYMTNLEITTCGILMNWSRDSIFRGIYEECEKNGKEFFSYMDDQAEKIKTELLVLPQFGSSGNPNINYDAKGLIWGLTIHTKPEEIYLAIKESMAFQMRMAYECAASLGSEMKQMVHTGGGAASRFTMQLRADVFGIESVSLKNKEAGTMGCMIAAATAMGYYKNFAEGVRCAVQIEEIFKPRLEYAAYYEDKYERYKRLYEKMYDFK